ncbi:MAG: hypothetical protein KC619_08275 [Myxococcales bacterium]|nr:hypothetical protein [Myxococcales bacterium]
MSRRARGRRRGEDLAASLGPGSVAVLQPSCTASDLVVTLAIGTQYWWAKSLTDLGRPAVDVVVVWRSSDGRATLGASADATPMPDLERWAEVRRTHGTRFGLASRFHLRGASRLDIGVWLFEEREEGLATLGEWTRDCSAPELAPTVFDLLAAVAQRVGVRPARTWTQAFGTANDEAAARFLTALGGCSLVEWGVHQRPELVLDALVDTLAVAPGMGPAIAHLPKHFALVRDKGGVSPFIVARAYRRAVDVVGHLPPEWRDVDGQLRSPGKLKR